MLGRSANGAQEIVFVVDSDRASHAERDGHSGKASHSEKALREFDSRLSEIGGTKWQICTVDPSTAFLADVDAQRAACVLLDVDADRSLYATLSCEARRRGLTLGFLLLAGECALAHVLRALLDCEAHVAARSCSLEELTQGIDAALAYSRRQAERARHQRSLEKRFTQLSRQDRAVLHLVLKGQKNRAIAARLGVSLRTVENRRRRCLTIMQAASLADLTRSVVEFEHNLLPTPNLHDRWLNLPFIPGMAAG